MAQETNQTQGPMLCATGCGFYGNPRTNGMCSVCYKDFLQRQNNSDRVSPAVSSGVSSLGESLPTQCTDSSTVDVSSAFIQAALPLETSSIVASQTLLSQAPVTQCENEESAGAKVDLKTEETQMGASVSIAESLMDGAVSSGTAAAAAACAEDSVKRGKRKLDESAQELDGECASGSDGSGQTSVDDQDKCAGKSKAKKNRCFTCRKKVGLTGFDCRCGNVFCGIHRYSDIHNCTFDYKADAAEKIRKENPVIVGEKIQKI
ncbi:AN1-type zinc finger protein 6 isoform X2 [Alosa sapidissima]|uniref:AN1-type zinc finger protein 6 isoform X2 n=1 Tax=Alosa sapidissima TaxID=34773 RepID=UPI001C0982E2|nr:AN1-type zinc finger protein 6 isoform X2 [Alosa sapidissima]